MNVKLSQFIPIKLILLILGFGCLDLATTLWITSSEPISSRIKLLLMLNLIVLMAIFTSILFFVVYKLFIYPLHEIRGIALGVAGLTSYLSNSISHERWLHVKGLIEVEKQKQIDLEKRLGAGYLDDFLQTFLLVMNGFEVVIAELSQYSLQLETMNLELESRITARTMELEESNEKLNESINTIQQTQGQLLQQEKLASIGQLAAGVAHEINNPIGYVGSNINRLAEYFGDMKNLFRDVEENISHLPSDVRTELEATMKILKQKADYSFILNDFDEIVKESSEGITRIKDIVQSLKDFSHNTQNHEFSIINVAEAINTSLKVLNNEIKYNCDVSLTQHCNQPIEANLGQIHQIISNLIINSVHAIKATGQRGRIDILTRNDEHFAYIEIEDTGGGIPEDIHSKVFDPFFTTKPIGQGTGLGLNICYDLVVNKHKGELTFVSTIGAGTRFCIKLPLKQEMERILATEVRQ